MKSVLVIGTASTVAEDLAVLEAITGGTWRGEVIAVNRAGVDPIYAGRIHHWATLHPDLMPGWLAERRALKRRGKVPETWSNRPGCDNVTDIAPTGSSGLFAARVAIRHLNADRVVLAGVPITDTPHYYDGGALTGPPYRYYRPEWQRFRMFEAAGRVRSLSGWTGDVFGHPTREWLA